MKNSPCFVVFSDDWGEHPSSCQHLFRRIAQQHEVLWVNTVGMREPTLTWKDLRKAAYKIRKMIAGVRSPRAAHGAVPLDLHVCQPFMLPFSSIPAVRRFNRWSVLRRLRSSIRSLGIARPIIVSTVPNACDYVDVLGGQKIIYYCVDDFAQWPGLEHDLVRNMEQELIGKSDVLVATSRKLQLTLSTSGKPVSLLTHGVDAELFSRGSEQEHPCLAGIPRPRMGYFGLFDERSDQLLLQMLAQLFPERSFVITGPVVCDTSRIAACSNVYFTGPVAYAELPSLVAGLDVLFIPYLVNSFTDSISPLKLKEYLATGKPVIVTPLAEAFEYSDLLTIAKTPDDWASAIRHVADSRVTVGQGRLLEKIASESWDSKVAQFLALARG